MTPSTFNFSGDAVTFLGFIGILSTLLIVVTSFKRFYNSPYNIRVTSQESASQTTTETTES